MWVYATRRGLLGTHRQQQQIARISRGRVRVEIRFRIRVRISALVVLGLEVLPFTEQLSLSINSKFGKPVVCLRHESVYAPSTRYQASFQLLIGMLCNPQGRPSLSSESRRSSTLTSYPIVAPWTLQRSVAWQQRGSRTSIRFLKYQSPTVLMLLSPAAGR